MKKKISAICLTVALSMAAMPVSQAASLKDFIGVIPSATIDVGADIALGQNPVATYENGPLRISADSAAPIKVDYQALIKMDDVKNKIEEYKSSASAFGISNADIENVKVSGEFILTINYPTENFNVPDSVKTATGMDGFGSVDAGKDFGNIFEEKSRDASQPGKLVIKVGVKSGIGLAALEKDLGDMTFTCTDVDITAFGTYTVTSELSGSTTLTIPEGDLTKITYNFKQIPELKDPENNNAISATVQYSRKTSGGGSLGGGSQTSNKKTLTIIIGDNEQKIEIEYGSGATIEVSEIQKPTRPGYIFDGFYKEADLKTPLTDTITMNEDTTIYVKWIKAGTGEEILEMEKHYAYIIGYPTEDGRELVKPKNNITREEVATIFYRLLKTDARNRLHTLTNDFSDVDADRWSNEAISTIANGGYVTGYDDGEFKPANPITRAEFVTITSRLFGGGSVKEALGDFNDVSGHWAENYIYYAVEKGWISGYGDGTFKPNQYITRAEVMKIVNSMLNRSVNSEGIIDTAKTWDDNSPNEWYYYDVIEATNAHIYEREDATSTEKWYEVVENDLLADKIEPEKVEVKVETGADSENTETTDENATEETTTEEPAADKTAVDETAVDETAADTEETPAE
ncbi:MAG: S-layer homology domain-containing protein [Clostridia bacterium]|nr:S-layer homology domain-containing protein [Clostridia bacterium]